MNKQRLDIKSLLDMQGQNVWSQSKRRKFFYNKQLNRFKYYYVAWKRFTYYIYLEERFGVPIRFHIPLSFFKKNCSDVNVLRFQF